MCVAACLAKLETSPTTALQKYVTLTQPSRRLPVPGMGTIIKDIRFLTAPKKLRLSMCAIVPRRRPGSLPLRGPRGRGRSLRSLPARIGTQAHLYIIRIRAAAKPPGFFFTIAPLHYLTTHPHLKNNINVGVKKPLPLATKATLFPMNPQTSLHFSQRITRTSLHFFQRMEVIRRANAPASMASPTRRRLIIMGA